MSPSVFAPNQNIAQSPKLNFRLRTPQATVLTMVDRNSTEINTNGKRPLSGTSIDDDSASASKRSAPRSAYRTLKDSLLNALLKDGKYSDLVLKCRGEVFNVHKAVICPQSDFFEACVESGMRESVENVIELVEEEPDDVKRLLEFFYSGDFWEHDFDVDEKNRRFGSSRPYHRYKNPEAERSDEEKHKDPLVVCMRMFGIGNKFGIPGLKDVVMSKVKKFSKSRLPVESVLGEPRELGRQATDIVDNLQRLLDASEYCFSVLGEQPGVTELVDILLHPLAKVAPLIIDTDNKVKPQFFPCWELASDKSYMDTNPAFRQILQRINRNAQLGSRLFSLACLESFRRIRTTNADRDLLKLRKLREDTEAMFKLIAAVLQSPEKITGLQCNYNVDFLDVEPADDNEPGVRCGYTGPMLPVIATCSSMSNGAGSVTLRCPGCKWEMDVVNFQDLLVADTDVLLKRNMLLILFHASWALSLLFYISSLAWTLSTMYDTWETGTGNIWLIILAPYLICEMQYKEARSCHNPVFTRMPGASPSLLLGEYFQATGALAGEEKLLSFFSFSGSPGEGREVDGAIFPESPKVQLGGTPDDVIPSLYVGTKNGGIANGPDVSYCICIVVMGFCFWPSSSILRVVVRMASNVEGRRSSLVEFVVETNKSQEGAEGRVGGPGQMPRANFPPESG
ncbi:hypothetical protein BJ508DRAFT_348864 [Ascobolus immersus RN42]|uniref:BTB domain-containing protein n=1 Tax=Ascobolus immersus RN42 TaxID=1160509 RepID=A0A3N4I2I9_ASCIM|nr:hypothetical protein BJ508DRAFT_348864 [Ascobolus immersus RN42]